MKNLKEFKELIETYRNITIQDISNSVNYKEEKAWSPELVMEDLTGFGTDRCSLCKAIENPTMKLKYPPHKCVLCTWVSITGHICFEGPNHATYTSFTDLEVHSEEHLVEVCKTRAEYMNSILIPNDLE